MPIFTTAVSGSGTNRAQGLEHGGVASHFTGSIHIFSGSFPGQMGLNITGSALATDGVYTTGIHSWNFYGADAQVMSFNNGSPQVDFMGGIKVGGNVIKASDGGSTITMDTSDNVTIAGDMTVGGGDIIFANTQDATIDVADVSGTNTAGKSLTILAGAGTGTGVGGIIQFKAAQPGGTGSSVNAHTTILSISPQTGVSTFAGPIQIPNGDAIKNGDGENVITVDADQRVGIGGLSPTYKLDVDGDIRVRGNDIRDNSGNPAITFDGSANTTIAGDLSVAGGDLVFGNGQNASVDIEDVSGTDIAGKNLSVLAGAGTGQGVGGQIDFKVAPASDSSGAGVNSHSTILTLASTGVATFAGSVQIPSGDAIRNGDGENVITIDADQNVTIGNNIKILGNVIQAADGGSTITMDTSDNVAIGGDLTIAGGGASFENTQNATIDVNATANTAAGKNLTISAGSTAAGGTSNLTGGNLVLEAGLGKGSAYGGDIEFKSSNSGGSGTSMNTATTFVLITPTNNQIRLLENVFLSSTKELQFGSSNNKIELDTNVKLTTQNDFEITGDIQIGGNDIKDSGGNTQITFSAGSKATFGYDIETTGTGSMAMLQIGTSLGNPIGDNNKGYPLRVSNDSTQNGSKAGIIVDTRDNDTIGAYAFEKQGNIGSGNGSRRGWYFDWSADAVDGLAWRNSESDNNKDAPFVINSSNDNNRGIRVGGGSPVDNSDWVQGILITGSNKSLPSQLKLRSHHNNAYGHAGGVPVLSWQYEMNSSSANDGYWSMGVSSMGRQHNEATKNALTICSPAPNNSAYNKNYQAITIQKGGGYTAVGIGGQDATTTHTYGQNRALIPTGTLHIENQYGDTFDANWDLSKAQLLLGNSNNSGGEIPAVIAFDVARESNPQKYTAHIAVVNNDVADGHEGFMHFGLYDGTGNTFSTRPRLRIDSQGAALFLSGTAPGSNAGWPRANDAYWRISDLDIPSGSITCVSLMDGSSGKDPATINLVSWPSTSVNSGNIVTGDNLGRIAWWSADSDIDSAGEQWQQVAAYIETVAPVSHGSSTYASGEMDFYVRAESEASPNRAMSLTGETIPSAKFPGKISSDDPTNVPLTIDGHRNYMQWIASWGTGDDMDEKVVFPYQAGDILRSGLNHPEQWRYCWTAPADGYIELVEATPMYNFGKGAFFINSTIRWYKVGNTAITDLSTLGDFGSDTGAMSYYTTLGTSKAGKPTTFDFGSGTSFSAGDRIWMTFDAGANDFYDEEGGVVNQTNYVTFSIIYVLKESALTT